MGQLLVWPVFSFPVLRGLLLCSSPRGEQSLRHLLGVQTAWPSASAPALISGHFSSAHLASARAPKCLAIGKDTSTNVLLSPPRVGPQTGHLRLPAFVHLPLTIEGFVFQSYPKEINKDIWEDITNKDIFVVFFTVI